MSNILFIKANDRPVEQSITVQMYETFLGSYKEAHPEDSITEVDLYKDNIPYYGNDAITGMYKDGQDFELDENEQKAVNSVKHYLDQFFIADKIVIAFPLWNNLAPAPLISYISHLAQTGITFRYTAEGPIGLAGDKKVVLLNARGSVYSIEPMASAESAIKPIKTMLGVFGLDTCEIIIEGHHKFQDRAQEIITDGLKKTAQVAAKF